MEPTDKELEDRLKDVGIRLDSPPSDVDELLRLLDQTEIYLSKVEQSPSISMSDALAPALKSLVTKEYLNHPEADVKVSVAACINEITRITAPDAPYNDSLMKEIFAVIVDAFEKLCDISGPSFSKRVSILETVAKVRSCVVMLDLECDDLILQMFKHFLKCIRPDHSINVFSSMETIMTLVLEDSEDISQELLHCLLSSVQKSKKDVLPVACRLAEKVISNCAMKLKPYLLDAVKSSDPASSDYGDVIASICNDSSVAPEQNEVDESKLLVPDEMPQVSEKLDKPGLEDGGTCNDKTRKVLSNGVVPLENGNPITETNCPEFKHENSFSSEQCRNAIAPRGENDKLVSVTEKTGNELDLKYHEAKSSSVQLTDASDSSRVDGDKETSSPTIRRAGRKRKIKSSMRTDGASDVVPETEVLLEPTKAVELQPLEEGLVGDSTRDIPVASDDLTNSSLSKMDQAARSQFSSKRSTTPKATPSARNKKKSRKTIIEKEGAQNIVSEHMDDHCDVVNMDEKPSQASIKKSIEDATPVDVTTPLTRDGESSMKEQNEPVKKVAVTIGSGKQLKSSIKKPKNKGTAEGDVPAEQSKEMIVSPKASREVNDDEHQSGKSVETSFGKKRQRKTSGWKIYTGRRIEVWWPDDMMFYKGMIAEFDPVTEKHKIVYDDGDVEFLLLANERWNYIDSKDPEKVDIASPEPSVQVPKKPRGSSGKSKATPEKDGSVPESDGLPIQQSRRGKSAVKSRGGPRQETLEVDNSPIKKIPESHGSDGSKVEQSRGGKSAVKSSRSRSKQETSKVDASPRETSKVDASPSEKTPVSHGSDQTKAEKSRGGRRRPKQESQKAGISPVEKTQGTRTGDETKAEETHGDKLVVKPRGRYRKEASEVAPSLEEKNPVTLASDGTKVEESRGGKLSGKSRGRPRQENSKVVESRGSDGPKVEESPQVNNSKEPPVDNTSNKAVSDGKPDGGVGKSSIRSRRRSKGEKDPGTTIELSQTKVTPDGTPQASPAVKDDDVLTAVIQGRESGGNRVIRFRGRSRKGRKSRGKPKTSSISTQTDNLDFPLTDSPAPVIAPVTVTNDLESSKDAKVGRGKRKETSGSLADGMTDANSSAVKTSEEKRGEESLKQSAKRSAAKPNKRRRRK